MADRVLRFAHLAPFVQISREKYRRDVRAEFEAEGLEMNEEKINEIAEMRVRKEVKQWCSDYSVSGNHFNDNKWTGSICYGIYVSG